MYLLKNMIDYLSLKKILSLFNRNPSYILLCGSILSQLIILISIPIMSRLYSSESFGRFALFQSILSLVSIGAILKLDQAIIAESHDDKASELFSSIIKISLIEYLILFPCFICFYLFSWGPEYAVLAFISGVSYCVGQAFIQYCLRDKQILKASFYRLLQAFLISLMPLFFTNSHDGLIYGSGFGYMCFFILILISFNSSIFKKKMSWFDLKLILKTNNHYIKFALIPSLLDCACLYLVVHFITYNWGESTTGYFNMSKQLLSAPAAVLGVVISQLIIRDGSFIRQSSEHATLAFWKYIKYLFWIAVAFILSIFLFKNSLIIGILGSKWGSAIGIIELLVYPFMFMFIVSPLSTFLIVRNKVILNGLWQTVHFVSIALLVLFKYSSLTQFLIYYSSIEILMAIIYIFMIRMEISQNA